jgi:hypothetical protein
MSILFWNNLILSQLKSSLSNKKALGAESESLQEQREVLYQRKLEQNRHQTAHGHYISGGE